MKIHYLAFLMTVASLTASNKVIAQTDNSPKQEILRGLGFKADSLIKTAPRLRTGYQPVIIASNFAKKPQYGKDGAPVPMPNAYQPSKDTSVPIPTLKINIDSLTH